MPTSSRADHRRAALLAASLAVVALVGCGNGDGPVERGRAVAQDVGCLACHSTGTDDGLGPGLGGVWGERRTFVDGSIGVVDEEYLRRSVIDPDVQVVDGFDPIMPALHLSDDELADVIAYLREVAGG